jgi:superfamily II DNA or RNA helicase
MQGLVWTTNKSFKNELVAKGRDLDGPIKVECWETDGDSIGIPRQFAIKKGLVPENLSYPEIEWPKLKVDYRKGQKEAVEGVLSGLKSNLGGITELHTGFGKTLVALDVAARLNTRVLVIAHKEDLLNQFEKAAEFFFGVESGRVQGDLIEYLDKHVTVATVQTLHSRINSLPSDFWNYFGLVVADEGHRMPSATFTRVFSKLSAKYRLGMSATFRRFDNLDKIWEWHIGDLLYTNNMTGIPGVYVVVHPKIKFSERAFYYKGDLNVSRMLTHVSRNTDYNKKIADCAIYLQKQGRQVLIVSDRTEQLWELSKFFNSDEVGFYSASITVDGKKKNITKAQLEAAKTKPIVLGTYSKIAEGSDIPSLDTLIFATPRKDIQQVVGRIRREYKDKKTPVVVDFVLDGPYNYALANCRSKMYQDIGFTKVNKV